MSPAVVGENETPPAIARYGFFLSEMLWPALGDVIVTEDVDAAATAVVSATTATRAAARHMPIFKANLLLRFSGRGCGRTALPR